MAAVAVAAAAAVAVVMEGMGGQTEEGKCEWVKG